MKKIGAVLLAFFLTLSMTGCENQVLMNERLIIRGIGIDSVPGGGYKAAMHVMKISAQEDEVELLTAEGNSVAEALDNVTLQAGKLPLYSQNLLIIIGRECAENGIYQVIDFFVRYFESRPTVDMFMAHEKAEDILATRKEGKLILTQTIANLAKSGELNSRVAKAKVLDVVNMLNGSACFYLPILWSDIDSIYTEGTAVFHGDELVGVLTSDQTRGFLLATKKLKSGTVVLDIPEDENISRITLDIKKSEAKIKPKITAGLPDFSIEIECQADISGIDGKYQDKLDGRYYAVFEKAMEKELCREVESALQQAVFVNKSDIFSFGRHLMKEETGYWKQHEEEWPSLMIKSQYTIKATVSIKRVGQEITPEL